MTGMSHDKCSEQFLIHTQFKTALRQTEAANKVAFSGNLWRSLDNKNDYGGDLSLCVIV